MTPDTTLLIYATVVFLLAGSIKGLTGMGLPTASIGLLTLMLAPRTAATLVLFPMLMTNAWQLYRSGEIVRALKDYALFIVILVVGVWITTRASVTASDQLLYAVTGSVIIVFVVSNLSVRLPPLPSRLDQPAQALFGAIAGITGGLTALWAPPLAIYLALRQVDKDEFVRVSGLLIFAGSIPLCIGFLQGGHLTGRLALYSAAMVFPALLGFAVGERLRAGLSPKRFREILLFAFFVFGLNLLRRAWL